MNDNYLLKLVNEFELDLKNNLKQEYERTCKCIASLMKQKTENKYIQDKISYICIEKEKTIHNYKIAFEVLEKINNKNSKKYEDVKSGLENSLENHIESIKKDIDIALKNNNNFNFNKKLSELKEKLRDQDYQDIENHIKYKEQLNQDERINKLIRSGNYNIAFKLAKESESLEKIDEVINTVKQEIFTLIEENKYDDAITFINMLNKNLNIEVKEYYDKLINKLIERRNFNIAFNLAKESESLEKIDEVINTVKQEIFTLIKENKYDDAITFINTLNKNLNIEVKEYYDKLNQIYKMLQKYDFINSKSFYDGNQNFIKKSEYLELKSHWIKEYLKKVWNIDINEEQANAIAKESQNVLITARAGSGKTRTIACRAIFALEQENINPEEIMILAFNTKAAQEISTRINSDFNYKNFNKKTARTFDSLAYGIINPNEDILTDDSNNQLTKFIQNLYTNKNIWNENFKEKIYKLYRADSKQEIILEQCGLDKNDENYENYKLNMHVYQRNERKITLDNIKVKSNGEKWIADFLFEHNISYKYEKVLTQHNFRLYKPDFTIFDNDSKQEIILEHWGIDENDKLKQVPEYWIKTWDDYYKEMEWKRGLCNQKGKILVETSIVDLKNGRKNFEELLKNRLESVGIKCKKLSKEEILDKIEYRYKDKIALGFANFIQRAEKEYLSPNNITSKINNTVLSERNKEFIELAVILYDEYQKKLKEEKKTDFGNIMIRAIDKIHKTKGECKITIGEKTIKIKDIKFLLIDEFQDFSKLFYKMVSAIKEYNPALKLFCVGDDWQAINGFAGSNLEYFKNFKFGTNSEYGALTYNYRSTPSIVEAGNNVMKDFENPAKAFKSEESGGINIIYIDNTDFNIHNKEDSQYMFDSEYKKYFSTHHRYFKECYKIIENNLDKTFIIMHRTNCLCQYYDLYEFKNSLIRLLYKNTGNNVENKIRIGTVHKFKGAEADIAIILECTNNNFPLIHPDRERNFIFGNSIKEIIKDFLNEEKRLFYVAVTRAKEQAYFLTEKLNESEYLKYIK